MGLGTFPGIDIMDNSTVNSAKAEIMDFDPEIENEYVAKTTAGIDRFMSEGGRTVLFDFDGTIRGNNLQLGISNYIRRGFVETYKYAKAKGLRIGICSLRNSKDIDTLEHLGITFDEYSDPTSMQDFIRQHPSIYHETSLAFQNLPREAMITTAHQFTTQIKEGHRPEGWEVLVQAAGEMLAKNTQYPNIKILYIAHKIAKGEKIFLIDDDEASGGTAEKLGIGVHIPRPTGYTHDKTLS